MKLMHLLLLGAVIGPSSARAQEDVGVAKGRVELSTSATLNVMKEGGEFDESVTVLNLPVRAGYFVTDHVSLEGEVLATLFSADGDNETGALVSGSALYQFMPKGRTTPFLLVGGGIGNGVEYINNFAMDADRTVKAVHAGAGFKTFLGRRAAFRTEYRFTHYSGSKEVGMGSFSYSDDLDVNVHKVFVGMSLFFR